MWGARSAQQPGLPRLRLLQLVPGLARLCRLPLHRRGAIWISPRLVAGIQAVQAFKERPAGRQREEAPGARAHLERVVLPHDFALADCGLHLHAVLCIRTESDTKSRHGS